MLTTERMAEMDDMIAERLRRADGLFRVGGRLSGGRCEDFADIDNRASQEHCRAVERDRLMRAYPPGPLFIGGS